MVSFLDDIEQCLKALHNGGLILYPTDTIWGVGCDATNDDAVAKVFRLKNRSEEKSLIILVADERQVMQHVAGIDLKIFDYLKQAGKPVTVVYDGAIGLSHSVIASDGSIAIRIAQDEFCTHLIKRFRRPIVATSANISGDRPPSLFRDIADEIKKSVDYIVKYKQDDETINKVSSIVRFQKDGTVKILRG